MKKIVLLTLIILPGLIQAQFLKKLIGGKLNKNKTQQNTSLKPSADTEVNNNSSPKNTYHASSGYQFRLAGNTTYEGRISLLEILKSIIR